MHVIDTLCLLLCIKKKKGSTCLSGSKIGKHCSAFVLLSTPSCCCCCLLKALGCVVIISIPVVKVWVYILHISRYDNVYIVSYVIHTCYILDALFLTTGLQVWICPYLFLWFLSSPISLKVTPNSVDAMTVPCPACNDCTSCKSHPVLFSFPWICWCIFLMTLEAVAKMCEL